MRAPHILADSSVWIDHISGAGLELAALLRRRRIILHPMVIGELALGSLSRRAFMLSELETLPQAPAASHREVMAMIEWSKLYNCGIGYVDAHLLAATRLVQNGVIWTRDKRLHAQAERLDLAYTP